MDIVHIVAHISVLKNRLGMESQVIVGRVKNVGLLKNIGMIQQIIERLKM